MILFELKFSRIYAARGLFFFTDFKWEKAPRKIKIFIKSLEHFVMYLGPFMLIMISYLMITTLIATNIFDRTVFLEANLHNLNRDNYLLFAATSLKLVIGTGWQTVD